MAARNVAFDRSWKQSYHVAAPVVSIGNLTTGGTGKTPLAAWITRWARQAGLRVVLVSRGYGSRSGSANDEALELASQLPDLVHLQQADRVAAAVRAISEFHAQLVLLDDGFQHRRLRRDLDIVLLDALEPFGFDHVLPRGLLRESVTGLRRAHLVGLSRANLVSPQQREAVRRRVQALAPQASWVELSHEVVALRQASGQERSWRELVGKPVAAFAGIGNPEGFRRGLVECGYEVVAWREFPDHHAYATSDLEALARWAEQATPRPAAIVCTHKDLVKIPVDRLGDLPLEALRVEAKFLAGEQELTQRLRNLDFVQHDQ
jgi:tetraacyldisaccharide 4'-kinase